MERTYFNDSKYRAAQLVSETVEIHFAQHLAVAKERGEDNLAPEPSAHIIESIIDAGFWASLRREEGRSPRISIAYLPPQHSGTSSLLEHRIPLTPDTLTKLSPGLERPGVYLGVWNENDTLYIWGTTLKIPDLCFVLDVSEPALLVIKHKRTNGYGKFSNVAVLSGDQIKIIDENNSTVPESREIIRSLLGYTTSASWSHSMSLLVQLGVSMRAHKRGGTLLIVPEGTDRWRRSILHPIKYAITPAYSGLAELMQKEETERSKSTWQASLRSELDSLAGLTAIDGATVISDQFELLAFGAKIGRLDNTRVEQIFVHEPILGSEPTITNPSQNGGTRHLSAAQFVYDQRDALALVASQDGLFTIFTWFPEKEMVQAYRIDALLL